MVRLRVIIFVLAGGLCTACYAESYDRVASIAEIPNSAEPDLQGGHGMMIDLVRALDRATHSSTKIVLHPFARSLKETAAGHADFHLPLIQDEGTPAPEGLTYVQEVDFGQIPFAIYSRKTAPLDAKTVARASKLEVEKGHKSFFPFPVSETTCVPCSLDKVLLGRTDALIVSSEVVDPFLRDPKYKGIHRAFYKSYLVRALVPTNANSTATRRYLIEGTKHLKETGELWKITSHNKTYADWQP